MVSPLCQFVRGGGRIMSLTETMDSFVYDS